MTTPTTFTVNSTVEFAQQLSLKYNLTGDQWAQQLFDQASFGVQQDAQGLATWAYQQVTGSIPLGSLDDLISAGIANGIVQTAAQWIANGYVLAGTTWILSPSYQAPISNSTSNATANS